MKFTKREPIIVLIAGKSGSGKSTLGEYLKEEYLKNNKKVVISPYTKYLKMYIEEITGKEIDNQNKPREYLQKISSDIIKKQLNKKDFFITRQLEDINIYSYFFDVIIIPDVRFPNEITTIKERFKNVISIGITRKDHISTLTLEQLNDETEIALDNYRNYDLEIENGQDVNLKNIAKEIVERWS